MVLTAENLTKLYGEKVLFKNINFSIDAKDKIGIVGVNGAGKSTLIKAVAGMVQLDEGGFIKTKNLRIGYLPQDSAVMSNNTVLMEVFRGSQPVMEALRQYEMAVMQSEKDPTSKVYQAEILVLSQSIDSLDGWQIESDAKTVLTKLGLFDFSADVGSLSGGQQKRLALAAALVQPCDLLILDEPTNHLDSETIIWLEEYLGKMRHALLMVTHDRYFLDSVATRILEIDQGKVFTYEGNYTQFLELRAAREEREDAAERKRLNLFRNELVWMRRGAQARSTKQKARIQRFEELKDQNVEMANTKVAIGLSGSRLGRTVIELNNVGYVVDGKTIIEDFSYIILRCDRVGIIGINGSGKSTLLNLVAGLLQPTSGIVTIGQTVKVGYFSQMSMDMDESMRAIEYIREVANFITMADGSKLSATQLMEMFLFSADLQWSPIAKLSGGEKRRLFLLRILMSAPNVLLLDEPTNDLDLQTLAVLEGFIDNFNGAVLIVSHDRFFLDRLVEKVFVYEGTSLKQYPGGYSDYKRLAQPESLEKLGDKAVDYKEKSVKEKPRSETKRRLSFNEQMEYNQIEAVIAATESELNVVRRQIAQGGSDYVQLQEFMLTESGLVEKLDHLMERWAYLEEIVQQ